MLHNQKGFIYPLSFTILLLASTFFAIYAQQYVIEKKLAHETESILKQEYLFLYSVRKLEVQLQNGEPIMNTGVLNLTRGRVNFSKEDLGTTLKFTFTITLTTGEKAIGFAYYNKSLKKMIKWVEKN